MSRAFTDGTAINVVGERQFTVADGVECGLSMAFEDAGLSLSDGRWQRLCKNAASEIRRQLRKAGVMDIDIVEIFGGSSAGTQVLLLQHLLQEQRRTREAIEKLVQQHGANGAVRIPSKIERVRA